MRLSSPPFPLLAGEEMKNESFDLLRYLEDRGIDYTESGKNVSSGWIGTNCLFCDDPSNHLGINTQSKTYSCFICGAKGNLPKLIQEIEQCGSKKAYQIIDQFQDKTLQYLDQPERKSGSRVDLPKGCTKELPGIFQNYFQERGFDAEKLIQKYDLYCCYITSDQKFKYRIIAPVYQENELVTYVGRDVTHSAKNKYQNCPSEKCIKNIKDCLYNIDSVHKKAIVVEGIFDVWRLGDGAVATFGTQFTKQQISLLAGLDEVFILFDSDAVSMSHRLAGELSGIVKHVEVIELEQGDPAELTEQEAIVLKQELFG